MSASLFEGHTTIAILMGYCGKTKDEVIELLQQFDWNWHAAADYLGGGADELRVQLAADDTTPKNGHC
jgi:hypothetical protein